MRSKGGRRWRRLSPVLAATVALAGLGLGAAPAAADTNISVTLTIDTPLPAAAANTLYVGQPAHYQLTVTAGPSDLAGVSFTDKLPADLTYNSVSGTGWSCVFAAPTITCNQANTVAATTTSTAALNLTVSATTTLSSVTFNPNGTATTPAGATGALAAPAIVPVQLAADLSLAKSLNPPPSAGQVSYNLAVVNHGPSAAGQPITISDTLPAGLTLASGTGPGWTCSAAGQALTCTSTTDLASGAASTVTVIANVPAGNPGGITTTASVTSATFDPNQANNTAAAPQSASLTLAATASTPETGAAPNTLYDGQAAVYQLTVTNTTAGPLAGITIADSLPPDLTYISASGAGWTCTGAPNLACTGADLTAGASSTLTLNVTVAAAPAANPIVNSPTAASTTPAFSTIATTSSPVLAAADIALVKALVAPPGPGQVSYTLAVTNHGPSAAGQPITISDTLPAGLTLASGTGPGWTCSAAGQALTCTSTTDLASGAASTVTVIANVPAGNPGGITTTASVTSATFDPNQANNIGYAPQGRVPYGNAADPGPCGLPSAATPPVRTCNLVASAGTITVPGFATAVPIWGFAIDPGNGTTPAGTVPGPTLVANEGETLSLSLRNALPVHAADQNLLAVNIPGLTTSNPDDTGIPSGASTVSGSPSYTWANLRPGTYIYEAGPTTNGARQVAMGLSGLLVVRPKGFSPANMTLFDPAASPPVAATACASPSGSSQFTAEQLVEVNDLSSEFHNNPFGSTLTPGGGNGPINTQSANSPGGSADVATYMPDVFLINGQAYPSTAATQVNGTDCVALHYANLGMLEKSYGVLGRRQTVMADDSFASAAPQNLATKYLNPGEAVDAVVDMTGATVGTQFPIMDFSRHLHNGPGSPNNATASANTGMTLGGQLAMLQVAGSQPATLNSTVDLLGLDHTTVAADAAKKITPGQLNLTARGVARAAGTTIAGGEFTIDTISAAGSAPAGQTLTAGGTAVIPTATFLGLGNGDHIIWVRVKDSGGNWSDPPTGVVFTFDRVSATPNPQGGPVVTNFSLDPSVTNGNTPNKTPGAVDSTSGVPATSSDMVIDGTATPPLPDWAITGFSWSIDGGTSTAVPVNANPGSPVEINTAIPQSALQALAGDTTHTVSVTATETQGTSTRTGNPVTLTFIKAVTGPTATIDSITPNPAGPASDHSANLNYFPSVRIRGTLNDNLAQIAGGEMWFLPVVNGTPVGLNGGEPMADGQGVQVTPDAGTWTAPPGQPVKFSVDIPSSEFNGLPQGTVRIYVHGRDQAGSWNQTWTSGDLILDKTQPVIMDHTTGKPDPVVTSPSPGHFTLDFWAQDPSGSPAACTVTGTQITPQGCGIPETSKVTDVEWQISYNGVVDVTELNDFTIHLPAPSDGPVEIPIDLSGGPQPYPAGATVVYRIRDGAGNWTDWYTTRVS